jgi:S1-C subfamily serine protease
MVGRDPKTDLAVLRIEAPSGSFPVAELGDSIACAWGSGHRHRQTRSASTVRDRGIISATGRTQVGVATYEAFIQTDASINPGIPADRSSTSRGRSSGSTRRWCRPARGSAFRSRSTWRARS